MNTDTQFERRIDAKLIMSIIATGLMSFSGVVVETAMNVTFPSLMTEFGVGTSTVQWITTGYLLILSIIIPASSWLKRRFTTKRIFVTAITLFIIGTVMCAVAPVFALLLLGRLIQGVGTGIALPLMFNIVLEQVPYEKMGLMMGTASLITAIAPAVGPSLGGMIVNTLGWRMIFVALLPLLVISLFMGVSGIRQVSATEKINFNVRDFFFLAGGFACFIFGINQASKSGWLSAPVIAMLIAAVFALAVFCRRSRKSDSPVIRLQVFRCAPFTLSVAAIVSVQFICLGAGFLIPNYAQLVMGENAFTAGCLLLPGCILGACTTPLGGRLLDRFGAKLPIPTGNIFIIISTCLFALFLHSASIAAIIIFYVLFAFGQSFSMGTNMTNGLSYLPDELNSDGNAVINTMQQLSGAVGTCVVSTIVASSQAAQSVASALTEGTLIGTQSAFVVLFGVSIFMLCCVIGIFKASKKYHK